MIDKDYIFNIINKISKQSLDKDREYFLFHKDRYSYLIDLFENYYGKDDTFLDIGSYLLYMNISASLIGYDSYGIDINLDKKKSFKKEKKYNLTVKECDLYQNKIPFASNFFNLILFSETLEHLNFHPNRVFKEISRVLKPAGRVIITVPNLVRLNNRIKMFLGKSILADIKESYTEGTHYREYTELEIKYLCEKFNLSIEKIVYINFDYPNISSIVKFTNSILGFIFPKLRGNLIVVAQKN